jgi:hypothetical protein
VKQSHGYLLAHKGVPLSRDGHVLVPVQCHPHRALEPMGGDGGCAGDESGAGLFPAKPAPDAARLADDLKKEGGQHRILKRQR